MSLPSKSNFRFYGEIQLGSGIPVVFLATSSRRADVVVKLSVKNSSCVAGPFGLKILISEVGTLLQHTGSFRTTSARLRSGNVGILLLRKRIFGGKRLLSLATTRCGLLYLFVEGPDVILAGKRVLSGL